MAKTLVITGADFSTNKLDTVILTDPIPCSGLSFSKATDNVDYGDTYSITYTVTPADTTDPIVWASNNANITVSNGTVTVGGVGSATITATCGNYTASITLTSTATYDKTDFSFADDMYLKYSSDYASLESYTGRYVLGRTSETDYHVLWSDATTQAVGITFCPFIIPAGCTSVSITSGSPYVTQVGFAQVNTQSDVGSGAVKCIDHDSSSVTQSPRTISIPSGATGIFIGIYGSASKDAIAIVFS